MRNSYDFNLSPYNLRQESSINSILESRLVPRDLSELEEYQGDDNKALLYIDNNGTSSKLKLSGITNIVLGVVNKLPSKVEENKLLLVKDGAGYSLYQGLNGQLIKYELKSDAGLINYTNEDFKVNNVEETLDKVIIELNDVEENSVRSLNSLVGKVDILTGKNIELIKEGNDLIISSPNTATKDELNSQKDFLKSYTNNAALDCKNYTDSVVNLTVDELEEQINSPITTVEILPEEWGGVDFPYTLSKKVTGVNITSRSNPSYELNLVNAISKQEVEESINEWNKIYFKDIQDGKLVLRATDKITKKLVINIRGF